MALTYKVQFGQECHHLLKVWYVPLLQRKRGSQMPTHRWKDKAFSLFSRAGLVT